MPRAVRTKKAAPATPSDDAIFRALADRTRRRIVALLGGGEMRVSARRGSGRVCAAATAVAACDIAAQFDVSRPAISKHLAVLKRAGLVRERRHGRERLYAVVPDGLRLAAGYAQDVDAFWREQLARLDRKLRE